MSDWSSDVCSSDLQLVDLITDEGLSTEWDGPAFDAAQFPDDAPLMLYAHEVAWGRLDGLKAFCLTQALPFVRWSGGYPGQFGPERAVFTGAGEEIGRASCRERVCQYG